MAPGSCTAPQAFCHTVSLKMAMAGNAYKSRGSPCAVRRHVARPECTSLKRMKNDLHAAGLTSLRAGKLSARPPPTQWLLLLVLRLLLLLLLLLRQLLLQLMEELHSWLTALVCKPHHDSPTKHLDFQGYPRLTQPPM